VPKIYELFKNDHRFFVVMEYKHGESLADVLQSQRYFEEGAAAGVAWQLLALLSHCHKRGITHTDLKLTSICFNSKRQDILKVMDFSISKIFRVEEVVDQSIGRAVLSAPETVSGQTSSKSDIWSCGIILYILLCGEPPIIANTRNRLIHKFKSCICASTQFSYASESGASG
jgi:calcium-dependent protein kinase